MTGFLAELRRRRVLPIAGVYIAGAWLATEVLGFLLEQAGADDVGVDDQVEERS